jgi:hypothetical protein
MKKNPIAKHMNTFNKPKSIADKRYKRRLEEQLKEMRKVQRQYKEQYE